MTKSTVAAGIAAALSLSVIGYAVCAQTSNSGGTSKSSTASASASGSTQNSSSSSGGAATSSAPAVQSSAPVTQTYTWSKDGKEVGSTSSATTRQATTTSTTRAANTATSAATNTTSSTTTTSTTTKKKVDDSVVIHQQSRPLVSDRAGWQKFYQYITLDQGQESLSTNLIFKNGTPGHTPYDAIKLFLAGQPLATNKDFRGGQLTMKMDGTLSSGNNPLIIEAYGPIGSELTWKLVANKPVITAVKPETTGPSDSLTINGRNFSSKAGNVIVTVGGKQSTVVSSSSKSISIKTPTDLANGENNLVVSVAGIESKPFKVTSKSAAPELSSCSMVSAPPGQQITVSGKGFSNVSSENEVTIGGMVAPISSGSSTSLTVTIPGGLTWPQWNVPIIVKTKNVESKGSVTINLNQRVIPNDGVPEQ